MMRIYNKAVCLGIMTSICLFVYSNDMPLGVDTPIIMQNALEKEMLDLSHRDGRGHDFTQLNFASAHFAGALWCRNQDNVAYYEAPVSSMRSIAYSDFTGANVSGVSFAGTYFNGLNITDALVTDTYLSVFQSAHIFVINYDDLAELEAPNALFSHINLLGAQLQKSNFENADLRFATLIGANLEDANLAHADLSYADLRGAYLRGANLRYTKFNGALLDKADLSGADASHALFVMARMHGGNLTEIVLEHANVQSFDHTGVPLLDVRMANALVGKAPEFMQICRGAGAFIMPYDAIVYQKLGIYLSKTMFERADAFIRIHD